MGARLALNDVQDTQALVGAIVDREDGSTALSVEAERRLGAPVHILTGEDEAEASALGVVSGIPRADGLMGDLGGGSLEIVALDDGVPGRRATLPLGSLRLGGAGAKAGAEVTERIDAAFWVIKQRHQGFALLPQLA